MISLPELALFFALIIFVLGMFCVMFRSNMLFMMMGLELLLNAANLAFVAASKLTGTIDGQVAVFFVMTIAACEAAVGLGFVVALFRAKQTTESDSLTILRG